MNEVSESISISVLRVNVYKGTMSLFIRLLITQADYHNGPDPSGPFKLCRLREAYDQRQKPQVLKEI